MLLSLNPISSAYALFTPGSRRTKHDAARVVVHSTATLVAIALPTCVAAGVGLSVLTPPVRLLRAAVGLPVWAAGATFGVASAGLAGALGLVGGRRGMHAGVHAGLMVGGALGLVGDRLVHGTTLLVAATLLATVVGSVFLISVAVSPLTIPLQVRLARHGEQKLRKDFAELDGAWKKLVAEGGPLAELIELAKAGGAGDTGAKSFRSRDDASRFTYLAS